MITIETQKILNEQSIFPNTALNTSVFDLQQFPTIQPLKTNPSDVQIFVEENLEELINYTNPGLKTEISQKERGEAADQSTAEISINIEESSATVEGESLKTNPVPSRFASAANLLKAPVVGATALFNVSC